MRKLIGILMALCIFTALVSSASACVPSKENNYCKPIIVKPPSIDTPKIPMLKPDNVDYWGSTAGEATSMFGCYNEAQVSTEAGQNSLTSGYSITNAYAYGDGYNEAVAWGGSGFHS
jgi:hypothetical protein